MLWLNIVGPPDLYSIPIVKVFHLFRKVIVDLLDLNGIDKYWIIWFFKKEALYLKAVKIFNPLVNFFSLHW